MSNNKSLTPMDAETKTEDATNKFDKTPKHKLNTQKNLQELLKKARLDQEAFLRERECE